MSFPHKHVRIALAALCCVALGAGASAIASAGAATSTAKTTHQGAGAHAGALRRLARRAVHADLVVPTKTGFATVTLDRGRVDSVSGQQLTITEGTAKRSYKTVTLTIPSTAKVRDNRQASSLSSLTSGQRVIVISAPAHTWVIAHTPRKA